MTTRIVDPQQIKKSLADVLGLTGYEARAYVQLLRTEGTTVSELSQLTGIPRTKCYAIVKSLAHKNMIAFIPSKPIRCKALDPDIAVNNRITKLMSNVEARLRESRELINQLNAIRSITDLEERTRPEVILVEGPAGILSTVEADITEANKEILIAISSSPVRFDWRRLANKLQAKTMKGIEFKYIVPSLTAFINRVFESHLTEAEKDFLQRVLKEGWVQLRECGSSIQPFAVIDEKIVHLFFTNLGEDRLLFTLRIKDKRFARYMKTYFEFLWHRG